MSATDIYEIHEREQHFFDQETLNHLSGFLCLFAKPCCLCAPLLGAEVEKRGVEVTIEGLITMRFTGAAIASIKPMAVTRDDTARLWTRKRTPGQAFLPN